MRVDMPLVPQTLVESPNNVEKNELTSNNVKDGESLEEDQSFLPTPLGSGRTYSVSSLKAAVDYHAKFLTVAESNLQAVQHPPGIPQPILDRLNGR
jgi:hypothetical protein